MSHFPNDSHIVQIRKQIARERSRIRAYRSPPSRQPAVRKSPGEPAKRSEQQLRQTAERYSEDTDVTPLRYYEDIEVKNTRPAPIGRYATNTTPSETSLQKTPLKFERDDTDTDTTVPGYYPSTKPVTDMSKAPLFFGKPGQFETIKTWCDITFLTNDELAQSNQKKAAFFASLFRGPVLTWFARQKDKTSLLQDYDTLVERVKEAWDKSDRVKEADAARRLTSITQRKAVRNYANELSDLFETLNIDENAKQAIIKD
ncbi:hypothetical protein M747DRAFT_342253 [Aspergillus niger ATCC 13496]|uniref:Retrotransposon gag domain-containing protein n=1 Tax=Aspergillus niger ATCC 13496 TaxID=1353008 RepID=A0A370BVG4_ASPNG|nr:hypothetical protein M747DRAFT_342253 [Aspergillus niger ATCC 13496]